MISKVLGQIALAVVLTSMGLAGGWYARTQTESAAAAKPAGEGEEKEEEPPLSPQALKNMGVSWGKVEKKDFVVTRKVPAVVEEIPSSLRPVVARWGGTVMAILPGPRNPSGGERHPVACAGLVVKPGEVIMEILRAPLPMIDRTLTGEIVQAVSEAVHEAATELKCARKTLELAELEWKRVHDLNKGREGEIPVIPRQTEIDLRYEKLKAAAEVEKIQARLYLHGLTQAQVDDLARGAPVPPSRDLWKRALQRNGLWCSNGDKVLGYLPETLRAHPWTFAGLGELIALGRCDGALVKALATNSGLGKRFHELVALIQQGHSLRDVVDLYRSGFLDPTISVRAPEGAPAWEVREIHVRPGEMVEAGAPLALLGNPERIVLELETAGVDTGFVEKALQDRAVLEARPLVAGAGPNLSGIRLAAYRSCEDAGDRPRAYAIVKNEPAPIAESAGPAKRRAWRLRAGMRYMVVLPVRTLREGFVLPLAAVIKEGGERVVFIRSGDGFKSQPVHITYEDFETVVVANDGSLFSGDPVVLTGAFQLGLALRAAGGGGAQKHKHGAT